MTDEERMLWTENGRLQGRVGELEGEVAKLLNTLADERTENMRLRAALEVFACDCGPGGEEPCTKVENCRNHIARAAMEEGMTSPDEREDCTGLEDSSTANPCGREDCEEEGL